MIQNGKKNGKGVLRLAKAEAKLDGLWKEDVFVSISV